MFSLQWTIYNMRILEFFRLGILGKNFCGLLWPFVSRSSHSVRRRTSWLKTLRENVVCIEDILSFPRTSTRCAETSHARIRRRLTKTQLTLSVGIVFVKLIMRLQYEMKNSPLPKEPKKSSFRPTETHSEDRSRCNKATTRYQRYKSTTINYNIYSFWSLPPLKFNDRLSQKSQKASRICSRKDHGMQKSF